MPRDRTEYNNRLKIQQCLTNFLPRSERREARVEEEVTPSLRQAPHRSGDALIASSVSNLRGRRRSGFVSRIRPREEDYDTTDNCRIVGPANLRLPHGWIPYPYDTHTFDCGGV